MCLLIQKMRLWGIEPQFSVGETDVLPLDDNRITDVDICRRSKTKPFTIKEHENYQSAPAKAMLRSEEDYFS